MPGTLPGFLLPDALDVTDSSFLISVLWHWGHLTDSRLVKTKCSEVKPQLVQINSKIGIS